MLALALCSPAPYLEVMRHLVEDLRGQGLLGEWHIPVKSSLFRARQRAELAGCRTGEVTDERAARKEERWGDVAWRRG